MLDKTNEDVEDGEDDEVDEEDEDGDDDDYNNLEVLETGGYDDPQEADPVADAVDAESEEIDSDEAFADGDEEQFKGFVFRGSSKPVLRNGKPARRPVAADFLSSSEDEVPPDNADNVNDRIDSSQSEESDEDDDVEHESRNEGRKGTADSADSGEEEDASEEEGESDDGSEEEGESDDGEKARVSSKARLGKLLEEGNKSIMAPISQSARAEAEKGLAVRQQRRAYDSLLNIRIRLQKALIAVNSLTTVPDGRDAGQGVYEAAEEAALKLWNTIDGFRDDLSLRPSAKAGEKRKRAVFDADSPSQDIWEAMEDAEGRAGPLRREILDNWSAKVQRPTTGPKRRLVAAPSQTLTSVLDDQLLSTGKLIARTRKPRSCAPVQAARKVEEDRDVYDDADFYQVLLKELVEQRAADGSAPGSAAATVRWAAVDEAKTRRHVDRRASKGRKLRFNAHEKLQNFMAPEDRTSWEAEAVDRFFGTLFGQPMAVRNGGGDRGGDADGDADGDAEMGGVTAEEEGLRLFRS